MANYSIQIVSKSEFVDESSSINSNPNASAYFFVLRCLLIDIDLNARTGLSAMMMDSESTEKTTNATAYDCDPKRSGLRSHLKNGSKVVIVSYLSRSV